jgi:arsenate reductase-like glutaredoxin family protein
MEEYLWLSKNPKVGVKIFKTAEEFARNNNCEYMFSSVVENHPLKNKIKTFYKSQSFEKDSENFVKKL